MPPRSSRLRRGIGVYLLLLLASHLVRAIHPWAPSPADGMRTVGVPAARGDLEVGPPIRLALLDVAPPSVDRTPVVLIHGSPGSHREVSALTTLLGGSRRALAPDLPGFGGSTHAVPDYSILAHARMVLAALDSLGIERVHVLGFSMGGGVALSMAGLAPQRIASITLLSAIGAQEYELLGDYLLNHAVHGIQLAALWVLHQGVPHFGWWDGGMLSIEYARNFYDTDQRPLRAILSGYQGPVLILQGAHDDLVNPAVAVEHHRIAPQSELVTLSDPGANHFMAFSRPDSLAPIIGDFLERVDRGEAVARSQASPERSAAAERPFDPTTLPKPVGLTLAIVLLLIAGATFLSEDLACIATGLLVARGTLGFWPGTAACFVGIVIGDLGLYGAGRWLGRPAIRRAPLRWLVSEADLARTSAWFARYGPWVALVTRFVPGTRLPTYLAAGILHASALAFLGVFVVASALWTPLLVGASALFGNRVLPAFTEYQRFALPTILLIAAGLVVLVKLIRPLGSWRGRRLLLGRWLRIRHWEFWPRTALYSLMLPYLLWLAWKHRSLTVWTAANPGIPGGGFAGESKAAILASLGAPELIAPWRLIPPGSLDERLETARDFLRQSGSGFPVVLKPDVGERGAGVAFPRDHEMLRRYLEAAEYPVLIQRYVDGVELGAFYVRMPEEESGRIFAVTRKELLSLRGDGRRTVEELILGHPRAVAMAPLHLARMASRLAEVPPAGATVPLVEVGTHSRGSVFYDGGHLATDRMREALDRVSQGQPGFMFGRYDLRGQSIEAIQAGDFQVIEANGTGSEATSMYDPTNGLRAGLRVLRHQWGLAFEIGRRNVAAGARPATIREMIGLLRTHRRAVQAHLSV